MRRRLTITAFALILPAAITAGWWWSNRYVMRTYAYGAHPAQKLDVYPAHTFGTAPAIILIYGGSFLRGSRQDLAPFAMMLAAEGVTAILPGYRLLPDGATWPEISGDIEQALRFTNKHADRLGIDPARLALAGHSVGGMLATWLAERAAAGASEIGAPRCLITFGAPWDVTRLEDFSRPTAQAFAQLFSEQNIAGASPLQNSGQLRLPVLLVHGLADDIVSPWQATAAYRALAAGGAPVALLTLEGEGHGAPTQPANRQLLISSLRMFLSSCLGPTLQSTK